LFRVVRFAYRLVKSFVPFVYQACSVIAFRNDSFEILVIKRMVLHHHGQAFIGRIERGTLGHGPAFQNALHLNTEVVVKSCRMMTLYLKAQFLIRGSPFTRAGCFSGFLSFRFGIVTEASFFSVTSEAHAWFSDGIRRPFCRISGWPSIVSGDRPIWFSVLSVSG